MRCHPSLNLPSLLSPRLPRLLALPSLPRPDPPLSPCLPPCQVTYKAFEGLGHLDVTFGMKEEVRRFVLARLAQLDGIQPPRAGAAGWRG